MTCESCGMPANGRLCEHCSRAERLRGSPPRIADPAESKRCVDCGHRYATHSDSCWRCGGDLEVIEDV